VKTGNWIREWRGLYRLARYPWTDDGQYALWSLWSSNRKGIRQGIYSHQTALALFDLSDVMPEKLHMTVPSLFRRHSDLPQVLILHRGDISPRESEEREGYSVTRPARTIVDCVATESVSTDILRQAFQEAKKRGLLREKDFNPYVNDRKNGRRIKAFLKDVS
jgi:predicted transcriptional regulator of viral defense system